jgi:prolyl-tRNA synthetase
VRSAGAGEALATPEATSIEQLASGHGFDPTQVVKVLLLLARFEDGLRQPLLISLRGDQQLNEVKLVNALATRLGAAHGTVLGIEPLGADLTRELRQREGLTIDLDSLPMGYLGPDLEDKGLVAPQGQATAAPGRRLEPKARLAASLLRLTDTTAAELTAFVCGANLNGHHRVGASWTGLGLDPQVVDLRASQPGDRCLHDPAQTLSAVRGIEVGHIFQLGRKYAAALDATYTSEAGQEETLWMGCYGIGVSRLAQAAIEQNHDASGLNWPVAIAPFEAIVVSASAQDPQQVSLAEAAYDRLRQAGIDALLDDRDERAGVKFKDADLIGIPWRLVVGRGAARGEVELVCRADGQRRDLPLDQALEALITAITAARRGLEAPV